MWWWYKICSSIVMISFIMEVIIKTSHPVRHLVWMDSETFLNPSSFKQSTLQTKVCTSFGLSTDSQNTY